jgi:hypothetical protein
LPDEYLVTEEYLPTPRHSGPGIASFVIALLVGVAVLILVVAAGVIEASTPGGMDEESPVVIAIGLGIFAAVFGALIGGVLGIVGVAQGDRRKTFAVLGLVLNGLVVVGLVFLVIIGLAAQGAGF